MLVFEANTNTTRKNALNAGSLAFYWSNAFGSSDSIQVFSYYTARAEQGSQTNNKTKSSPTEHKSPKLFCGNESKPGNKQDSGFRN